MSHIIHKSKGKTWSEVLRDKASMDIIHPERTSTLITNIASTPSSHKSYLRYGVTRSFIQSLCINNFHFPADYLDTLSEYFILHWKPVYFKSQLSDGTVTLHNGTKYLVVYQNCTPYEIAKSVKDIRLSFRKPQVEFNIPAYVIVRLYNE